MINTPDLKVSIQEMLIIPDIQLSGLIANELMKHAVFLSDVREESGKPLYISKNSGYRPTSYEIRKGRDGTSEHTTFDLEDRGAVDIIYDLKQFQLIYDADFYTRICYYPDANFFHCDRKPTGGQLQYFEFGWDKEAKRNKWIYQGERWRH